MFAEYVLSISLAFFACVFRSLFLIPGKSSKSDNNNNSSYSDLELVVQAGKGSKKSERVLRVSLFIGVKQVLTFAAVWLFSCFSR